MSENLKGLFNGSNEDAATNGGARSLAGTARLTTVATEIANDVLKTAEANFDDYQLEIAASKHDHGVMDTLVNRAYDLTAVDVSFLKELSENVQLGMLKSQQSKRSRCKSKPMTMVNYRSMMTAAIAEHLLRQALGKDKTAASTRRVAGSIEFTAEELAEISVDQERVRREIRNIQSKKSIYKSKDDFSESDEYWQRLLVAEEQLKNVRTTPVKDDTKDKLTALLEGQNFDSLKAADAKALLKQIASITGSTPAVEE